MRRVPRMPMEGAKKAAAKRRAPRLGGSPDIDIGITMTLYGRDASGHLTEIAEGTASSDGIEIHEAWPTEQ